MTAPLIALTGASLGYDDVVVLRDVDFTVSPGEVVAVLGPNGSGKSTLVKSVLGLAQRHGGNLTLFGVPAHQLSERWRLGYVPQRHSATGPIPATVQEVVASGRLPRLRRFARFSEDDRQAIARSLDQVGLADLAQRPVAELSGGQQRRVLIARALASEAELLLLDEPTAGVDVEAQAALAAVLSSLAIAGTTIVLVTHELGPMEPHITRIVWVSHGRIEYDGPPTTAVLAAATEPFPPHHDGDVTRPAAGAPDLGLTG